MSTRIRGWFTVMVLGLSLAYPVAAQEAPVPNIEAVKIRDGLHMLVGEGAGNLAVLSGSDGVVVIDDQFQERSEKLLAAIRTISDKPLRFVINTHWHLDHAGGNGNFARAGAVLVAQDNARKRLEKGQFMAVMQRMIEPAEPAALPVITFSESMHFYINGQDVHVLHIANAHTDGDSIIHFPGLNVFHTGDTYLTGMYPFIDAGSGGSIDGFIATIDAVLPLMDDESVIIPGHGGLSNKAEYTAFREMLVAIRASVRREMAKGLTREQLIAAKPTAAFDARYGKGFITPDVLAGMLFDQFSAP